MAKSKVLESTAERTPAIKWFDERDAVLLSLGFGCYGDYLQSSLWEWIRSSLHGEPKSSECLCCGSRTGLTWHHRSYELQVLVGNFSNASQIIIRLCCDCHEIIHRENGRWFDSDVVAQRLKTLNRQWKHRKPNDNPFLGLPIAITNPGDFLCGE